MSPLRFLASFARAPRSRLAVVVALGVLASLTVACRPVKPPAGPPPPPPDMYCDPGVPTNADQYQAVFDKLRASNAGYFVAADGGIPNPLPDGKILWFFGDTVLGRWTPGGPVSPYLGVANNSFVLQQGGCFKPLLEAIPDQANGQWIWPTGAVTRFNGTQLLVFGSQMRKIGDGPFGFELVQMVVATFSLPNLSLQSIQALPFPTSSNYGETVFTDGTHIYAYGRVRQPGCCIDHHYVARALVGSNLAAGASWEYWDEGLPVLGDEGFVPNSADADPMQFEGTDPDMLTSAGEGPTAGFPVVPEPSGFFGSALHFDVIPSDLETWHAPDPQGPWMVDGQLAYNVPDYTPEDRFAYGGRVVLGLPSHPNTPIALWSINHESFDAVLANPKLYEVAFVGPSSGSLTPP